MHYERVLSFWFEEIEDSKWWVKDSCFDELIKQKFLSLHYKANQCECFTWRETAKGRLAEIIVLDQFSRNLFRGHPQSFSSDSLALALAQEAVLVGADCELSPRERTFLYMPYMHSESILIHDIAMELFAKNGIQTDIDFEIKHRNIIQRFGRYPHRNVILNRVSTDEEIEFLKQPGSSF